VLDPNEKLSIEKSVAEERSKKAFEAVFEHGVKIQWDHHLVYHARAYHPFRRHPYPDDVG
jgi:hypothetical protein